MTKPAINQLGAVGLMLDGDPAMLPDNAFTDALNVRFNGREVSPYNGNLLAEFYTTELDGTYLPLVWYAMQAVMFDGFSAGSRLLFGIGPTTVEGETGMQIWQQTLLKAAIVPMEANGLDTWEDARWNVYKGQINNCPFFGIQTAAPVGKQYDWTGFDALPAWGEQTGGDQIVVTRRWTCKKMVSFDNRLLMLNTIEENSGGEDVPYPTRVRWSGFAQENSFPINWDDTAANRTPEEYAAAVIDGFAGWQDLSSASQIIDACENGGTLYVYTERETYTMTPSGNDQSPFVTRVLYSDLGCIDINCVVNAHGYNYVFNGSDLVRHDAVSWVSVADEYVRDWLADYVKDHMAGQCRLMNFPELSEIWVMLYGTDQTEAEYAKTVALTYNYLKKTWSKKTLPFINDAEFCQMPPDEQTIAWDENDTEWDKEKAAWGGADTRTAQGTLIGCCQAGGVYLLNTSFTEARHVLFGGVWSMKVINLQCYAERRGMEFNPGYRSMISDTVLNGKGTEDLTIKIGRADWPDSGYTWSSQVSNLTTQRRNTWRAEGGVHGYRLQFSGTGSIPVGITFTVRATGR
ncbi:hypothetical protein GZZ44_10525 [Klebsiella aerogenes]|uniref:hypothetical protein n=1 Tax=Klebsiella aerogenes TaxID=548 RepID=UPI00190E7F83|nr:hypothetical protein [Klebsiella aerogenes]MBK0633382.1 hypothetical protein [Klebsiella aerogenes]